MSDSKKTLIEANILARLLSLFYDSRDKGNTASVEKALKAKAAENPEYEKAYAAWEHSSEKLLLATKRMLQKSGLKTDDIDALLKKYHNY